MKYSIAVRRAFVVSLFAAWPSFGQQSAPGTSAPCEQGAIFAPGKATMTLVLCSSVARDVPELKGHVLRVESMLASRDSDARRDIDLLRNAVNGLARQLKPTDTETLARSLAAKMAPGGVPESRLLGELSRLRIDLRDIQDKIDALRKNPTTVNMANEELKGATGTAIAQFNFARANDLLDGLARVERKVDAIARDVQEVLNPAESAALIASDRRVAEDAWQRFLASKGEQRCPVLHDEMTQVLQQSRDVELNGGYGAARAMLATVMARSNHATMELMNLDRRAEAARQAYDRARADADQKRKDLEQKIQLTQQRADNLELSRQRSQAAQAAAAAKLALRAEAESQEATETLARAQANVERARAMPSRDANEATIRAIAIQQTEQALKLAELQHRQANRPKRESNSGDNGVSPVKAPRNSETVHLERLRAAHEHLVAGLDLAAQHAAAGRQAKAAASLKSSLREVEDLSAGRALRPQKHDGSDEERPFAFTACR